MGRVDSNANQLTLLKVLFKKWELDSGWTGYAALAQETGLSLSTVKRHFAALNKMGVIRDLNCTRPNELPGVAVARLYELQGEIAESTGAPPEEFSIMPEAVGTAAGQQWPKEPGQATGSIDSEGQGPQEGTLEPRDGPLLSMTEETQAVGLPKALAGKAAAFGQAEGALLIREIAVGRGWAIEVTPGNRRVIAEIFPHPRGIVFADIGWDDPGQAGNPFHVVEGQLDADGAGYRVGEARIIELTEDDPLAWEWLNWVNYLGTPAGRAATREACAVACRMESL